MSRKSGNRFSDQDMGKQSKLARIAMGCALAHVPGKQEPVFRSGHAQTKETSRPRGEYRKKPPADGRGASIEDASRLSLTLLSPWFLLATLLSTLLATLLSALAWLLTGLLLAAATLLSALAAATLLSALVLLVRALFIRIHKFAP
jgi:hypothetical protein